MKNFNMPIVDMLKKHIKKEKKSFHMPGHKAGMVFSFLEDENNFLKALEQIGPYDLTEVDTIDNLHNPKGPILEAMDETAKVFEAGKSFFLVNGSSCGIHAMIYVSFKKGDKVFVSGDSHISVFNSLMIRGIRPIILPVEMDYENHIPLSLSCETLEEAYRRFDDVRGLILTSPNYYGICPPIEELGALVKENKGKLLVDEAHGGHFGFSKRLPKRALARGAHMSVTSAHKTLQAFNQGAYLHIKDPNFYDRIINSLRMVETTSPSFLILASLDFSREYMKNYGKERIESLIEALKLFEDRLKPYSLYKIFKGAGFEKDPTRLVINCQGRARLVNKILIQKGIFVEMVDDNNLILILSPSDDKDSLDVLFDALTEHITYRKLQKEKDNSKALVYEKKIREIPLQDLDTYLMGETISIPFDKAKGKISASFVCPYPPGIPIIFPGQRIEKPDLDLMAKYCIERINVIK